MCFLSGVEWQCERDARSDLDLAVDSGDLVLAHPATLVWKRFGRSKVGDALVPIGKRVVTRKSHAEHSGFVDQIGKQLHALESCCGRVQRSVGKTDPWPTRNLLGGNAEDSLGDQQIIGEAEILQASAGEPLEDLTIALHHGAETCAKLFVLPLALDVLRDRFAHSV
jgi:hypothetical protein